MCIIYISFVISKHRYEIPIYFYSFFGGIGAIYITAIVVYKYVAGDLPAAAIHDHT